MSIDGRPRAVDSAEGKARRSTAGCRVMLGLERGDYALFMKLYRLSFVQLGGRTDNSP